MSNETNGFVMVWDADTNILCCAANLKVTQNLSLLDLIGLALYQKYGPRKNRFKIVSSRELAEAEKTIENPVEEWKKRGLCNG